MNKPLITIFIPTYKRPQMLKKAIESALSQTYQNIQVVVCDNASGDDTHAVVSEYLKKDPRLRSICHSKNMGMLANYQFALSRVETEFFSFLSDDDFLLPCFCELALEGFAKDPDIAFFAGSTVILSKEAGVLRVPLELWSREGRFEAGEGLLEMIDKYPVPTTVLFRNAMRTIEIDFQNPSRWDCDFLMQIAGQFPCAISKQPCGIMISHPSSYTTAQSDEISLKSIGRILQRVEEYPWMNEDLRSKTLVLMKEYFHKTLLGSIVVHLMKNRMKEARKSSFEILREAPVHRRALTYLIASCSFVCSIFPFMRFGIILLKNTRDSFRKKTVYDYNNHSHI